MRVRMAVLIVVLGALVMGSVGAARQETLTRQEAIGLVRAVNTMQAQLHRRNNAYLSLRDVITDPAFALANGLQLAGADAVTTKGYVLTLARVEGSLGYQLSLVPSTGCGPSWFSSHAGLIYAGDCLQ